MNWWACVTEHANDDDIAKFAKINFPPPKLPAGVMIVVAGIENDASLCVHDC